MGRGKDFEPSVLQANQDHYYYPVQGKPIREAALNALGHITAQRKVKPLSPALEYMIREQKGNMVKALLTEDTIYTSLYSLTGSIIGVGVELFTKYRLLQPINTTFIAEMGAVGLALGVLFTLDNLYSLIREGGPIVRRAYEEYEAEQAQIERQTQQKIDHFPGNQRRA